MKRSPHYLLSTSLSAILATFGLSAISFAQDTDAAVELTPAEIYQPTRLPDRIVLNWNDDPRSTQAVTWRTSTDVKQGVAQILLAPDGPIEPESATSYLASSQILKTDLSEAVFHSVSFKDLQAGELYAYRVGDGKNWSEWFQFRTAPAEAEPFTFIYLGDGQNGLKPHWSRALRQAYRDAPKAAFILHAGDLINRAEADGEWGEWFHAGGFIHSMLSSVSIPGNHEMAKREDGSRTLTHHWRTQFELPLNGPKGLEETCYTLVYGDLRIICLNSNEQIDEQREWLAGVLEGNESKWIVCMFHHPIYSTARNRDNASLRTAWKPLFDKYRVDLVLQGHDHAYGRTGNDTPWEPLSDGQEVSSDELTGTVYVVSVSGPKMYGRQENSVMRRMAEDTQLYQMIEIDGDQLQFQAKTVTGKLYDAFTLKKAAGSANVLVDQIPEMPMRLRPTVQE